MHAAGPLGPVPVDFLIACMRERVPEKAWKGISSVMLRLLRQNSVVLKAERQPCRRRSVVRMRISIIIDE